MILDLLLDLQLATLLILLDGKGLKTVYLFIYYPIYPSGKGGTKGTKPVQGTSLYTKHIIIHNNYDTNYNYKQHERQLQITKLQ